jgi:hypothetical protein
MSDFRDGELDEVSARVAFDSNVPLFTSSRDNLSNLLRRLSQSLSKWCLLKCRRSLRILILVLRSTPQQHHAYLAHFTLLDELLLTKCSICRTNLAIIVVMMQLAKKVPFDNPDVLMLVRGIYILSNVIILSLYLYTQAQIKKKNGWSSRALRIFFLVCAE